MEDFESVGIINGVPAHEFNVDVIEDKPWRIPGADITDYFNYGFAFWPSLLILCQLFINFIIKFKIISLQV